MPTQGLNPGLLHCRQILYSLSPEGTPLQLGLASFLGPRLPQSLLPCLAVWRLVQVLQRGPVLGSGICSPRRSRAGSHASHDLISQEHDQCISPAGAAALIASSTEWSHFLRKCPWPSSRCFSVGLLPPGVESEVLINDGPASILPAE